jgi:hypothetical protein
MIEELQMAHTTVCLILAVHSKLVDLCVCVDFVYVIAAAESFMYGGL